MDLDDASGGVLELLYHGFTSKEIQDSLIHWQPYRTSPNEVKSGNISSPYNEFML